MQKFDPGWRVFWDLPVPQTGIQMLSVGKLVNLVQQTYAITPIGTNAAHDSVSMTSDKPLTLDRPMLGIALMLGFCCLAPLGDATAKLLGQPELAQPVFQVVFLRFVMQAIFLIPAAMILRRPLRMSARTTVFVGLRTVFHILGVGTMFLSLRFLPLAETIAIAFVMPFILLLLGWRFMGESVGWRRLMACFIGFCGTLLVIQPSFAQVGWPAILPVGVAFFFAFFILVTRRIAKEVDPIGMQGVSGVMAVILMVPFAVLGGFLAQTDSEGAALFWAGFSFAPIPTGIFGLYLLLGLLGSFGHLLLTWSLRYAPSATLAPMQYLEIPIATLIGWVIFSDLPNGLAAIGILVTMLAGLYVILRERAIARQGAKAPLATEPGPGAAV